MNRFVTLFAASMLVSSFVVAHASDNSTLYKLTNCHGFNNCLDLSAFNSGGIIKYANNNTNNSIVTYMLYVKEKTLNEWEYPLEAAQNNITGSLTAGIILNRQGEVKTAFIAKSSGHKSLDEEAIKAINLASPYKYFPNIVNEDYIYIQMDFNYCLPNMSNNYCN
jgi:TonB family protein